MTFSYTLTFTWPCLLTPSLSPKLLHSQHLPFSLLSRVLFYFPPKSLLSPFIMDPLLACWYLPTHFQIKIRSEGPHTARVSFCTFLSLGHLAYFPGLGWGLTLCPLSGKSLVPLRRYSENTARMAQGQKKWLQEQRGFDKVQGMLWTVWRAKAGPLPWPWSSQV